MDDCEVAQYDPQLGWVPAIPEPFWHRHWLFWSRPSCYPCRLKFRTLADYNMHYINAHLSAEPPLNQEKR